MEQIAQSYEQLIDRFVAWAQTQPDIRAAMILGSRARLDRPADQWSDLDLLIITADPERLLAHTDWLEHLGTPWLTLRHAVKLPPNPAHLPERIGLFTLILLGESAVAVMRGMRSQQDWTPIAALSAFVGMALLFLVWWWYFDVAAAASERLLQLGSP